MMLSDQHSASGPARKHADPENRGSESARPSASMEAELNVGRTPERKAELSSSGQKHCGEKHPEMREFQNIIRLLRHFPDRKFFHGFRVRFVRVFPPQKQQDRDQRESARESQNQAPGYSRAEKRPRGEHCQRYFPTDQKLSRKIDVAGRFMFMQFLNERRGKAFDDALSQSRDHQQDEQRPVPLGERA